MIKIFQYCLDYMLIIDSEKKTIGVQNFYNLMQKTPPEGVKRVTVATINKHLKNPGEFVAGVPILSVFAPDKLDKWDKDVGNRRLIGEFGTYDELCEFFQEFYNKTKDIRKKFHFVNFNHSLANALSALRRGIDSEQWSKEHSYEPDKALFKFLTETA